MGGETGEKITKPISDSPTVLVHMSCMCTHYIHTNTCGHTCSNLVRPDGFE